jgi:glycosyltransferase 2 family protein
MSRRVVVQSLVGLAVSIVFGWLALRGAHVADMRRSLDDASYGWLVPALLALAAALLLKAERWRSLFSPAEQKRVTRPVAFWTLAVGLFFNSALPARAGEVARVLALHRVAAISRTQGVAAIVVERIFDLASLALLLLLVAPLAPGGRLLTSATVASAGILVAVPVLCVALVALRGRFRRLARAAVRRLPIVGGARADATLASLASGVRGLVDARRACTIGAWSLASWIALAVSNWFVLRAFDASVPWHAAVVIVVVTNLAQVLPATAGSLGVFEAACVASLAAYGVGKGTALPIALALHAVNLLPFLPLGILALGRLGLHASELRTAPADA